MKKIVIFLMSLVLSMSVYAQVPNSVFVSVPLDNTGSYTVDVLADGNTVYTVNVDVIQDENYNNGVFSDYINVPSEVWTELGNYILKIDDDTISVASVPFSSTAQYLADTKVINTNNEQVVRILANGKTLYVDAYDSNSIPSSYNDGNTTCTNKTITINNKSLLGSLPTISELKAIFNQSQYFENKTDFTSDNNKLDLSKYYWCNNTENINDDEEYKYRPLSFDNNPNIIYINTGTARVRCVYK